MKLTSCRSVLSSVVLYSAALLGLFAASRPALASTFVCDDNFDCEPNGTCGNDQKCVCDPGFGGDQCEFPCLLDCQNGGTCVVDDTHVVAEEHEFYCDCPPSHSGGLCQDPVSLTCDSDFECQPNGKCDEEKQRCICEPGYWGGRCEETCPIKCQNGGQCVVIDEHGGLDAENEFYCDCTADYTGGLCQTRLDNGAGTSSTLSSGAKAGIAVGVVAGVSLLAVLLVTFLRTGCRIPIHFRKTEVEKSGVDDDVKSGEPASTTEIA